MNQFSEEPQSLRHRVIYHGRVQGVGFRYTTASIAKRFPVEGYVKNLSDGTVEMVAEGSLSALQAFQAEIASNFEQNIDRSDCEELASDGVFSGFGIQY